MPGYDHEIAEIGEGEIGGEIIRVWVNSRRVAVLGRVNPSLPAHSTPLRSPDLVQSSMGRGEWQNVVASEGRAASANGHMPGERSFTI